jgi:hypothetical protein
MLILTFTLPIFSKDSSLLSHYYFSFLRWQKSIGGTDLKDPGFSRAPVAHSCNPSYSGSRDQEDPRFKASPRQIIQRPYLKKPITKKGVWQGGSSCRVPAQQGWGQVQTAVLPKKKKNSVSKVYVCMSCLLARVNNIELFGKTEEGVLILREKGLANLPCYNT